MTLKAAASPVLLVSATRHSQPDFERSAWLAASLRRAASVWPLRLRLFANNTQGLPLCYNQAIDEAADDDVLVFVHDDVYLDDWMLGQHLTTALAQFDVVGVAGNTRCQPRQLAWHCLPPVPRADGKQVVREWDTPHLSGFVAHGTPLKSKVQVYGPVPQPVALLDGVLLTARAGRLRAAGVRFDSRFDFHFYDLDFCRSASAAGLTLGTWPLAITHASTGGGIRSASWQAGAAQYLKKWRD